jgi:hypothetical protein
MKVIFARPHPGPLPQGEGETLPAPWRNKGGCCSVSFEIYDRCQRLFPLPGEEGQGEGKTLAILKSL